MLSFCDGRRIEEVKAERVSFELRLVEQSCPEDRPFHVSNLAFKNGLLNADPVIRASAGNASKSFGSPVFGSSDIVGDKDKHGITWG